MDDMEITYYDAHVKAHERHILLQWLEDAKTEKIKKLKEEKIATPIQKVVVPSPKITEDAISYSQVFDNPDLDVSSKLIIGKTQKSISYMPTIDLVAVPGISKDKTVIPDGIGEYKTTITNQMFSEIKIADIPVYNNSIDTEIKINTKVFEGIKTVGMDSPEYSDLSEPFAVPDFFSISLIKSTVPTTVKPDGVLSVKIPTTTLLNNNLFAGIIPQTGIDTKIPAKEKLVFNADLIQSINLEKISVPEQPKNTDIHIDHELPSIVSPIPVSVIPKKTVFETQLAIENGDNSSLPIVNIPESVVVGTLELSLTNNPTFDDIKLPAQSEIQDFISDIKMPEVQLPDYSVPEKSHIPEFETDAVSTFTAPKVNISTSSVKISNDIKKPEKIEPPKVYIGEVPHLTFAKPAEVSIHTPSVPITNETAKSVSELSFNLPKVSISGIKTLIPKNNDILEILENEIDMQNNS